MRVSARRHFLEECVTQIASGKEFVMPVQEKTRMWRSSNRGVVLVAIVAVASLMAACAGNGPRNDGPFSDEGLDGYPVYGNGKVRPGITVLLDDSIKLIAGKRVGLITNQTGIDEKGRRSIDLLVTDERAQRAGVKLVRIFSPEHGLTGTVDVPNIPDERDVKTGLMVHSLYQKGTAAPADSLLKDLDVIVVDLQDIGTRTWTYVGIMLYTMHAGARNNVPVIVLDRPNPISGTRTEGALLDSALANPYEGTSSRPGKSFALFPVPLRHGLTMGEMAKLFHERLKLTTRLTVVPMKNWRRRMWFDDTSLPWVKPSPNLPDLTSALLYPALVPFERANVSVGRGTNEPFQRFGAPWMRADSVVLLLEDLALTGVRFKVDNFTPNNPTDSKFGGQSIPGIRIDVRDRDLVQPSRIGAAVLWALSRFHRDSLRITAQGFDERMGSPEVREAILGGADPDAVMDRQLQDIVAFEREARRFYLYR